MKKKTIQRLSYRDRVMALINNPYYLKDLQKLPEEKIREKYNLFSVLNPGDILIQKNESELDHLLIGLSEFKKEFIVRMRLGNIGLTKCNQKGKDILAIDKSRHLYDGKYLTIEINLLHPDKDIIVEIKRILSYYKKFLPKDNRRNRANTIDHWNVYYLKKIKGFNFTQIARKLSGLRGIPSYNPELEAWHKKVKRAYNKACNMIKLVNPV